MNVQDILVAIIIILCIAYTGKHFFAFFNKKKRGNNSCGCNCDGCFKAKGRKDCDKI